MSMSALVALLSLNMTVAYLQAARTNTYPLPSPLPITAATTTTPIHVTSTSHGVPPGRVVHGIVTGVVGETELNGGPWIFTVVDANTFSVSTLRADGLSVPSVGVNPYVSGGQIQYAFPDYSILLGRRNIAKATAPATPRIVFVPTANAAWDFDPFGGVGQPAPFDPATFEVENAELAPQQETEPMTFDVYVSACAQDYGAAIPQPDSGDFDAVVQTRDLLRRVMMDACGGNSVRCRVLRAYWPSQLPANHPLATGTDTQRGQQWCGTIEFKHPVTASPNVYQDAVLSFDVGLAPGGAADDEQFTVGD